QTGGFQYVGLVHTAKLLAALHRHFKTFSRQTLHFGTGVGAGVVSGVVIVFPAAFSKIDTSGQFTQKDQVSTFNALLFQGRFVYQGWKGERGADIGEQSQFLAHFQQTLLGTDLGGWVVVKTWVSD